MDYESVGFTFVPTHQDGTASSASAFDGRIRRRFQHWRRRGHPLNERGRNDLERPPWKSRSSSVEKSVDGPPTKRRATP